MEVEVKKRNTIYLPLQNEIKKAFSDIYSIKARNGANGNNSNFKTLNYE